MPPGRTSAKPKGNAIAELATTNRITWAMPNDVPAATKEPERVRQRSIAAINDVNAGVPSRTAKTEAKDKYQFKSEQVTPIRMVSSQKIRRAAPGEGSSGRETDLATSTAPTTPM